MTVQLPFAVIRADASARIGGGHVVRCLALAEELTSRGWLVAFCATIETFQVVPELAGFPASKAIVELSDADPARIRRQWPNGADLLIVDHYELDASFEMAMRDFARIILVIDDFPVRRHEADLLLDTTLGRDAGEYTGLLPGEALCGADYALLRQPFRAIRSSLQQRKSLDKDFNRVVVNLGLTDPENATGLVLESIVGLVPKVDIILGEGAPHRGAIATLAERTDGWQFHKQLSANEMASLIVKADFVIGAAGISVYERCCLGKPMFLLQTADNQSGNIQALVERGVAFTLGKIGEASHHSLRAAVATALEDPVALMQMGARALSLVDGNGAIRIANAIMSI